MMRDRSHRTIAVAGFWRHWRSALAGAALCVGIGLALLSLNGWLVFLSYDLLFWLPHKNPPDDVVIVYMDDRSLTDLRQRSLENWDRGLHARLLDQLTEQQSKLVVFDVVFSEPSTPEADAELERAIKKNGRVVLAAALDYQSRPQIKATGPIPPLRQFEVAAAGWGLASVYLGPGEIVRQYYDGSSQGPGMPQVAAALAGVGTNFISDPEEKTRWLNYYGPPLALNNVSYGEARNQPASFFRGKVVFVGARPKTLKAQDEVDEFRTPHTLRKPEMAPGVEIGATAFLNLIRNDSLTRSSARTEWVFIVLAGLILASILSLSRPMAASLIATCGVMVLLLIAYQARKQLIWFPWTVVAFAQIPVALLWSLRCHFHRLKFEKEVLERTLVETSRLTGAATAKAAEPGLLIPDHALVRCVGRGAYGEVWLARNAIGAFHAVKIVQRRAFPAEAPYEREFKGIQKFMPISRSHPGFVNVLHVGRNDDAGYFFYIMEPADDQAVGQKIDPESYSPKTLATELNWRGKLPPEECVTLGIALSLALEHLHQQQLIHRDIKPGNIIYVNGAPKFADIGLVTEQRSEERDVSRVGTEGYIPPEGPGTPMADVYAVGKVLYEAVMGRDRLLFPEVSTAVWEEPDTSLLRRLYVVIGNACASNVQERYSSARELHEALVELRKG